MVYNKAIDKVCLVCNYPKFHEECAFCLISKNEERIEKEILLTKIFNVCWDNRTGLIGLEETLNTIKELIK